MHALLTGSLELSFQNSCEESSLCVSTILALPFCAVLGNVWAGRSTASLSLLEREIYLHGTQKPLKGVALMVRQGKIMELRGLSISRSPLVGPPLKAELENEYRLPGSKDFSPFDFSSFCNVLQPLPVIVWVGSRCLPDGYQKEMQAWARTPHVLNCPGSCHLEIVDVTKAMFGKVLDLPPLSSTIPSI